MRPLLLIIVNFAACWAIAAAELSEMDNAQLLETFRGPNGDLFLNQFTKELNSNECAKLVEKCLADEQLKKYLYLVVHEMTNGDERDKLLLVYMRDHTFWENAHDSYRDNRGNMAARVTQCICADMPGLRINGEDPVAMVYTLATPKGREAVATAYEKFLKLEPSERVEDNPKVIAILNEIRELCAKYGTAEHARTGGKENKEGRLPPSEIRPTSKVREETIGETSQVNQAKPAAQIRGIFYWIGGSLIAGVVALLLVKKFAKF
jgi:hypothetical protein